MECAAEYSANRFLPSVLKHGYSVEIFPLKCSSVSQMAFWPDVNLLG